MGQELAAFFWEREDAETVAALTGGTVRRERFQGEDDDEDHPWIVLLPADGDRSTLEDVLTAHDGWLPEPVADQPPLAPAPLPTQPKRLKNT